MKIYFLVILVFSFKVYGQTGKEPLFSKEELKHPLKVKELDLSHNRLKVLPPELIKFKNLEELDIGENPELDLSASFEILSRFKSLKFLSLSDLNKPIPDDISKLTSLEELSLGRNDLTSIPEGVKKLTRLRELSLWRNNISTISLQPGDLPNLEEIEFMLNKFTAFPDDLSLLPNLKKISFYGNQISYVSPGIKKFLRLEELTLRGNKLSSLPEEFGELKALRKLDLRENKLTSIAPLLNLIGLEWLDIGENQLTSITPLVNLIGLEELDIAKNKIEEIPANISILKNLKELSLYANPIRVLPGWIRDLPSLNYITIDVNDSAKLPAHLSLLAAMPQLKTLSIYLAGIKEMPPEFEKLTQVNKFLIGECDLTKAERKRLRVVFPKASFYFHKSWGDESFYKYKPCSMNEHDWDTISVDNLKLKYLFVGQSYRHTDNDGIHYWHGRILLNLDKKTVSKETAENILIAIADRLQMEDITAVRACRVYDIMHSAVAPKDEATKKYYKENLIGIYYRRSGLERY